jgi:tRNA(Ile)-lysidine synthase
MLEGATGGSVLVAVSGGPDSTCLLDVLMRLAPAYDVTLEVAHVDHRLSDASEDVAGAVASAAAKAGFDVHVGRAPDLSGPNLHARARAFRYAFFETVAAETGARRVATGHTLDDRVETTLARLIHGAATEGLAGIPPAEGNRIRPLIGVRRAETKAYCVERGLEFHKDPANEDARFERSVVRNSVVKAIEDRWGAGAVRAIASSSERLREDAEFLAALTETVYTRMTTTDGDAVHIKSDLFYELSRALRRRVLERAVGRVRDRSGGIAAVLDAAEGSPQVGLRFDVAAGTEIEFGKEEIVVRHAKGMREDAE